MIMRIHDLLEIDVQAFVEKNAAVPDWVVESLTAAPFVVVRRACVARGSIPVGVRGGARSQRWAGTCAPGWIRSVVTPIELKSRIIPTTLPAFRSLTLLAASEAWSSFPQAWGPGGSVGFELATGHPTVSPQSDLDLVIYADDRLSVEEAQRLHVSTRNLPSAVDVRVETPVCGFSLTEYTTQAPSSILLRTPAGVMLGADPWTADPGSARSHASLP
jgi:phosphoribosyl-dephospho-CoA transferase